MPARLFSDGAQPLHERDLFWIISILRESDILIQEIRNKTDMVSEDYYDKSKPDNTDRVY